MQIPNNLELSIGTKKWDGYRLATVHQNRNPIKHERFAILFSIEIYHLNKEIKTNIFIETTKKANGKRLKLKIL